MNIQQPRRLFTEQKNTILRNRVLSQSEHVQLEQNSCAAALLWILTPHFYFFRKLQYWIPLIWSKANDFNIHEVGFAGCVPQNFEYLNSRLLKTCFSLSILSLTHTVILWSINSIEISSSLVRITLCILSEQSQAI